jgi:3-hydroxyisobutyrate dehydrogenase-like beta-hydroxyacid dehydrogenase
MVRHFLKTGTPVTVWNRTPDKARALAADGASVADSPQEAVAGAGFVHFVLQDDAVVDGLLDRIAASLEKDAIVIDHSTTLPAATNERFARMRARGIRFVHAPVFMSPQMATDGVGLMLVSAAPRDYDEVRPQLEWMTGEVWYLGEREDLAAAYKLFGNAMLFAITGGVADVMSMARANGIDPMDALTVFTKFQPAGAIPARGARMARGDLSPSFTVSMARKDVGLMIAAAGREPLLVLPAIAKRMDETIGAGDSEKDLAAIGVPDRRS